MQGLFLEPQAPARSLPFEVAAEAVSLWGEEPGLPLPKPDRPTYLIQECGFLPELCMRYKKNCETKLTATIGKE